MPLFARSTLCVTPLVCGMWVVAAAGLPNSWPSWLWIRQLSNPLLSGSPFLHVSKAFCFFPFLFNLYQIHFSKKKNWWKGFFWMLPMATKISFWTVVVLNIMQFSEDISVLDTGKYRKLVLTGGIWGSCPGTPGLGRMYVIVGFEPNGATGPHWRFSYPNTLFEFEFKRVVNPKF